MPVLNSFDLPLRDLRTLKVLLGEHNLTAAAAVLRTSQPSVSKALARLRTHFHDPLLVRDGQNMRPTPKALGIMTPLRDLLHALDTINTPSETSFDPQSSDRTSKLLVSDVGMVRFLPPLTAYLATVGPKLKLEAVPLDSRHFETKLATGEAALALGAFAKAPRDLRCQQLYMDSYLSVVRRAHPKRAQLVRSAAFCAAQHIIVMASDTGHSAHQTAQNTVEAAIAPDRILLRLPSFVAAALVAAQTDGIATLPANLATAMKDQLGLSVFRPPIPMPPINVAQYWHERYQRDPGHRWLRQTCVTLFARARQPSRPVQKS